MVYQNKVKGVAKEFERTTTQYGDSKESLRHWNEWELIPIRSCEIADENYPFTRHETSMKLQSKYAKP